MAVQLNQDFVRRQFPSLDGEWVFMDNAGGSQTLQAVANRIRDYLLNTNVQLGASYQVSQDSGARVNRGIEAVADLINASDKREVILGPSTSMLLRNLSVSFREIFSAGDEIIVTNCDHEANIGPWRSLEKYGIIIKEWRVNSDSWELHMDDLELLMSPKTRLVSLTHSSNILGTINPIRKISDFVHEHGAMICVDGVAYAPHRLVDVQALNVDFYAFSFYKVYGPHYSVLYGKKEHLEHLPGINHFFLEDDVPYKFQPGSVNYELCYGITGVTDYFVQFADVHFDDRDIPTIRDAAALAYDTFARHEEKLSTRFLDFLNSKSNVRVIGKTSPDCSVRVPTFSFIVDGKKSSVFTPEMDKHHIGIRYGDFYARRLIVDLGLEPQDGVIRVSMVHYNTIAEIDRLIDVLDKVI